MEHPYGRCRHCGERLYAHVEGDYQCANCDRRYTESDLETRAA